MEDIFGVSGGYAPYLGTGPGTINAPFEMDNDYDSVPSTSRDSAATNGIDRRGSLQNNRQSPTGMLSRICLEIDLSRLRPKIDLCIFQDKTSLNTSRGHLNLDPNPNNLKETLTLQGVITKTCQISETAIRPIGPKTDKDVNNKGFNNNSKINNRINNISKISNNRYVNNMHVHSVENMNSRNFWLSAYFSNLLNHNPNPLSRSSGVSKIK